MSTLTIGQVARRAGVGIETVRFYEREGLIDAPGRGTSGYRQYGEDVIRRLRFIQQAKSLGFSLKEIRDLLALRVSTGTSCAVVRERTLTKIAEVEEKIEALQQIRNALRELTSACSGQGPTSACPILEAMEPSEKSGSSTLPESH